MPRKNTSANGLSIPTKHSNSQAAMSSQGLSRDGDGDGVCLSFGRT